MPELPDVEQFRRYFNATALHQYIERVHVQGPSLLVATSPQRLGHALHKKTFQSTARHGKYLFAELNDSKWLVLHFGMSGHLEYAQRDGGAPVSTQFSVNFDNGYQLDYVAPRKLGRIALANSPGDWVAQQQLGPDALAIGEEQFIRLASERHSEVKPWLMDQHSIAGIGNYYSDEILYQTGIHPKRKLADLGESDVKTLYRALHSVLQTAIERKADPEKLPRSFLLPQRRKGGHCPACGAKLETTKVGGRTAWYCPRCQKA